MPMKIGGEDLTEKIFPQQLEKLAEEAGLAKPLVKKRVPELAAAVIEALGKIDLTHAPAGDVAKMIHQRSREALARFKG